MPAPFYSFSQTHYCAGGARLSGRWSCRSRSRRTGAALADTESTGHRTEIAQYLPIWWWRGTSWGHWVIGGRGSGERRGQWRCRAQFSPSVNLPTRWWIFAEDGGANARPGTDFLLDARRARPPKQAAVIPISKKARSRSSLSPDRRAVPIYPSHGKPPASLQRNWRGARDHDHRIRAVPASRCRGRGRPTSGCFARAWAESDRWAHAQRRRGRWWCAGGPGRLCSGRAFAIACWGCSPRVPSGKYHAIASPPSRKNTSLHQIWHESFSSFRSSSSSSQFSYSARIRPLPSQVMERFAKMKSNFPPPYSQCSHQHHHHHHRHDSQYRHQYCFIDCLMW